MIPVGLGVFFLGYSVTYYGLTQLKGMNYGYLDLLLPGRWTRITEAPHQDNFDDDNAPPVPDIHTGKLVSPGDLPTDPGWKAESQWSGQTPKLS